MFLQFFWIIMVSSSLLWGMISGQGDRILPAMLEGTTNSIAITLQLLSGYILFCGLIAIVKETKLQNGLARFFQPAIVRLMNHEKNKEAIQAVCMNLTANLLGLGNAATPYGMEAARMLDASGKKAGNRHALYMLLIINATSIQLLPTTVLTLRIGAGSADPNAILLPSLLSTAVSTGVGVLLGCLCRKLQERAHGA